MFDVATLGNARDSWNWWDFRNSIKLGFSKPGRPRSATTRSVLSRHAHGAKSRPSSHIKPRFTTIWVSATYATKRIAASGRPCKRTSRQIAITPKGGECTPQEARGEWVWKDPRDGYEELRGAQEKERRKGGDDRARVDCARARARRKLWAAARNGWAAKSGQGHIMWLRAHQTSAVHMSHTTTHADAPRTVQRRWACFFV